MRTGFVFLFAVLQCVFTDALCPSSYSTAGEQCYKFVHVSIRKNWDDARSYCWSDVSSGDLLTIKSEYLKSIVWSHTESTDSDDLWIGAKNPSSTTAYWVDYSSVNSNWWLQNEPSSDNEKCVEVWASGGRGTGLNDEECHHDHKFACEAQQCFAIEHCVSGTTCQWRSSYFGENICGTCIEGYFSAGLGNGCQTCTRIANCQKEICTTVADQTCTMCHDNNVFYKLTNNDRACSRMCSSDRHYCWPGTCSDDLASNCQCAAGFKMTSSNGIRCQPDTVPEIHTCRTTFTGPNGEKIYTSSNTESQHCENMQDVYGNFQITELDYDMVSEFTIDITSIPHPGYITMERFGITDTSLVFQKISTSEQVIMNEIHPLTTDPSSSPGENAKEVVPNKGNLIIDASIFNLENAERFCVKYVAKAGGYLQSKHIVTHALENVPYDKTETLETKCYMFDNAPPEHCLELQKCEDQPISLDSRITRSGITHVTFKGWSDHLPNPYYPSQASGLEHFEIRVSETIPAGDTLKVDTKIRFEEKIDNIALTSFTLNLTESSPRLFCILLEVKDVAHNVRQARRFVLFDSTSYLEVSHDHPLYFSSASIETDYRWQTHLNSICLLWREHFFNRFYFDNNLLLPIEPEPHGMINGIFEQIDGILPVKGTPHVHGVIKYLVSWSLNGGKPSQQIEIGNFLNQTFCQHLSLNDGETYTFTVTAVDIVNNTLSNNRTVHIDHSPPHINEIGLIKDGYKGLVVHDDRDLSDMKMYFEALDPHSGLHNIEWWFGIEDTGQELGRGKIGIKRIDAVCPQVTDEILCYCPDIGLCEQHGYIIPLNVLVVNHTHHGDHHRQYVFKITATNIAHLSTTEHKTVLVDYSPPEVGVVQEGSVDGRDIDYTSADSIIINWHGFIDHESGVRLYWIVLAPRCLHRDEIHNHENISDIETFSEVSHNENNVRLNVDFVGKMYTSVIAFNNAMDPSDAVCSDGIIRDIHPPSFSNLTIARAAMTQIIVCLDAFPWLLNSNLTLSKLSNINVCKTHCLQTRNLSKSVHALPKNMHPISETGSSKFCTDLPEYTNNTFIYLPSDYLHLNWDIDASNGQIDDYYVGIGSDPSEVNSPQVITYTSSKREALFKHRHEGISPGEVFFIFIKAVSKTGLENVLTIGPMLIDSTPPLNKDKPTVEITKDFVKIAWNEDTFFDFEQTEQINRIQYILGDNVESERHEWSLNTQQPCGNTTCCCIHYSLAELQEKDVDLGVEFFVRMFVYNNAGHFTVVDTESFQVPSRYPPRKVIVFDIDPESADPLTLDDIDVHFSPGTLCATWSEKQDPSIRNAVGIGDSSENSANIVPFKEIATTWFCVNDSQIETGHKYYFLVKSIGSGGETVSASNGIVIFHANDIQSQIIVHSGTNCLNQPSVDQIIIETVSGKIDNITFTSPLDIGGLYFISFNSDVKISSVNFLHSSDIMIISEPKYTDGIYFSSYMNYPKFELHVEEQSLSRNITFTLLRCPSSKSLSGNTGITTYWSSHIDTSLYHIWYEAAIVQTNSSNSLLTSFVMTDGMIHTFDKVSLHPFFDYQFAIKPCTSHTCLDPVFSESFRVEIEPPTGAVNFAEVKSDHVKTCFDFEMTWEDFKTDSDVLFYQWTISKDRLASNIIGSRQEAASYRNA